MSPVLSAIQIAVIERLINNKPPSTRGLKWVGALCIVSFTLMVLGVIFIIYAGHIWLLSSYSSEIAALVTGGLCFSLALLLLLGVYGYVEYKRRRIARLRSEVTQIVSSGISLVSEQIKSPVFSNPKTTLLVAACVGFFLARKL